VETEVDRGSPSLKIRERNSRKLKIPRKDNHKLAEIESLLNLKKYKAPFPA
jgi:hypothetical protein